MQHFWLPGVYSSEQNKEKNKHFKFCFVYISNDGHEKFNLTII